MGLVEDHLRQKPSWWHPIDRLRWGAHLADLVDLARVSFAVLQRTDRELAQDYRCQLLWALRRV